LPRILFKRVDAEERFDFRPMNDSDGGEGSRSESGIKRPTSFVQESRQTRTFGFGAMRKGDSVMLYTILGILLVLWLLGFSMHVGGSFIHALLVIAAVVFLFNLISGRRSAV
jgi:hypothetical protein